MNVTVSSQMRVVALAGLVAVLGLAATILVLGSRSSSSPESTVPVQPARAKSPGAQAPAPPVQRAAPAVRPAVRAALDAGLPARVARAFARHKVVVVELYSNEAPLDRLALAEAQAGARTAGVGFVAIDVTARRETATRALATKLGILEAPAVLVFRRPGTLSLRIHGFSDHETVAQAAANAAVGATAA